MTLDVDLYKRIVKLEYLHPEFKNKLVFSPGGFHTLICALRCLGRTIEGSGLDDAWQEADLYSSVTVSHILNGNHYNRAIEAHRVTLQALFDLWLEKFLEDHHTVRDSLVASVKQLTEACKLKIDVGEAHRAFLVDMESLNLEEQLRQFDASQSFNNGEFAVNISNRIPFTRIGVDQAMEHLNKSTKGQGGISGITSYPATFLKFCLTAPELARLAEESERLVATTSTTAPAQHHQLSQSRIDRQERSVAQLKSVLAPCNFFQTEAGSESSDRKGRMFKLMSKEISSLMKFSKAS